MKEDITQPAYRFVPCTGSCGLVMKEDITQQNGHNTDTTRSCGLVMKEDITQPYVRMCMMHTVVVW